MESSPVAAIIKSLAGLHQTLNQSNLELWNDQEQQFQVHFWAQAEDRKVFQELIHTACAPAASPAATPAADAALPPAALAKMGLLDDLEDFIELFELVAATHWGSSTLSPKAASHWST